MRGMQPRESVSDALPLPARIALGAIACFWTFYFVIWSLRAAVLYHHQASMLATRAIVSLFSAGVSTVIYLVMRRFAAANLSRNIGLALVLAVPAALLYSTFNWYMFDLHEGHGWPPSTSAGKAGQAPTVAVGTMSPDSEDSMTPLQSIADQAGNGYFFFIASAALYLALSYAAEIGALERRTAALSAAAQAAELRALRYQVNPHFLFNTLNSLSALVMSGKRAEAERMILNLSTFFRTSLSDDPTEDVLLSEELRLQRLYLAIEHVRFPDRLVCEVDVPDALLCACIPGLILQPLIENAIKHAVSRALRPVTIRIAGKVEGTRLVLTVEDDGDPATAGMAKAGTGVGLRNVCDRLAARYGEQAACTWGAQARGGFSVCLALPLVHHGC